MFDRSTITRFVEKVEIKGPCECWLWTGAKGKGGYGNFAVSRKMYRNAHRIAYMIWRGAIATGKIIAHSCDNKLCCNPAHLVCTTHRWNSLDALIKGRWPMKISIANAIEIRMRASAGETTKSIAGIFSLSARHTKNIISGRAMAWLPSAIAA